MSTSTCCPMTRACRSWPSTPTLFEEFIARLAAEGDLDLRVHRVPARGAAARPLPPESAGRHRPQPRVPWRLPANYTVREVDSGCCGMAGSFGYEAEHYDISLEMGERRLLPAVRGGRRGHAGRRRRRQLPPADQARHRSRRHCTPPRPSTGRCSPSVEPSAGK